MESPTKYSGFLSSLENLNFETNDFRLENLRHLRRTSRDLTEAQARRENLETKKIPSLQAAKIESESRLKVIRDSEIFDLVMFEVESKKLGEIMREEAEETDNLGCCSNAIVKLRRQKSRLLDELMWVQGQSSIMTRINSMLYNFGLKGNEICLKRKWDDVIDRNIERTFASNTQLLSDSRSRLPIFGHSTDFDSGLVESSIHKSRTGFDQYVDLVSPPAKRMRLNAVSPGKTLSPQTIGSMLSAIRRPSINAETILNLDEAMKTLETPLTPTESTSTIKARESASQVSFRHRMSPFRTSLDTTSVKTSKSFHFNSPTKIQLHPEQKMFAPISTKDRPTSKISLTLQLRDHSWPILQDDELNESVPKSDDSDTLETLRSKETSDILDSNSKNDESLHSQESQNEKSAVGSKVPASINNDVTSTKSAESSLSYCGENLARLDDSDPKSPISLETSTSSSTSQIACSSCDSFNCQNDTQASTRYKIADPEFSIESPASLLDHFNSPLFEFTLPTEVKNKFQITTGNDAMVVGYGAEVDISTRHHCVTLMKQFEDLSFEELREEFYASHRRKVSQVRPLKNDAKCAALNDTSELSKIQFLSKPESKIEIPVFDAPATLLRHSSPSSMASFAPVNSSCAFGRSASSAIQSTSALSGSSPTALSTAAKPEGSCGIQLSATTVPAEKRSSSVKDLSDDGASFSPVTAAKSSPLFKQAVEIPVVKSPDSNYVQDKTTPVENAPVKVRCICVNPKAVQNDQSKIGNVSVTLDYEDLSSESSPNEQSSGLSCTKLSNEWDENPEESDAYDEDTDGHQHWDANKNLRRRKNFHSRTAWSHRNLENFDKNYRNVDTSSNGPPSPDPPLASSSSFITDSFSKGSSRQISVRSGSSRQDSVGSVLNRRMSDQSSSSHQVSNYSGSVQHESDSSAPSQQKSVHSGSVTQDNSESRQRDLSASGNRQELAHSSLRMHSSPEYHASPRHSEAARDKKYLASGENQHWVRNHPGSSDSDEPREIAGRVRDPWSNIQGNWGPQEPGCSGSVEWQDPAASRKRPRCVAPSFEENDTSDDQNGSWDGKDEQSDHISVTVSVHGEEAHFHRSSERRPSIKKRLGMSSKKRKYFRDAAGTSWQHRCVKTSTSSSSACQLQNESTPPIVDDNWSEQDNENEIDPAETSLVIGQVKKLMRHFGFAQPVQGQNLGKGVKKSVYFHRSQMMTSNEWRSIAIGTMLEFECSYNKDHNRFNAYNIRVISNE